VAPDASFETPSLVMQTAATTSSTKEPLVIKWTGYSYDALLVLHFAEIKNLLTTDRREFSITLNGEKKLADYIPRLFASDFKNFTDMGSPTTYICSLEATLNSTLPPLLNAIELYQFLRYPYVPTDRRDGNLIF
jgi:Malectin-like domain